MSAQEAATALNREKFSFFLFVFINLCLPFHEMYKHFVFGITLCQLIGQLRPLTSNPLTFFLSLVVYINIMYSCS